MTTAPLRARLQDLHKLTTETPLFNPVFQLSLDVSRDLEGGNVDLSGIAAMVTELECEALQSRATRLHRLLAPVDKAENQAAFRALVKDSAAAGDIHAFAARWAKPMLHTVFTGHPTFLLPRAQSDAVAAAAGSGDVSQNAVCITDSRRDIITLDSEHDDVLAAMRQAGAARDVLVGIILDVAADRWPDQWQTLKPMPLRLATWVGYDMDGRTDISWATSIRYRLIEKAERLAGYAQMLEGISVEASALIAVLRDAEAYARGMAALFVGDLSDPATLGAAANQFTADHPAKLLSLAPIVARLEDLARKADRHGAQALLTLTAAMHADGLGMGWIHFRVNSSQLSNAIRRRIDPDNSLDLASRTALNRMRKLIEEVRPLRSNFAALATENSTALRQFLAMVQILHHIDSDAPIRMLIAECEEPQAVLAALYFAKLFGISDKVDVSPLFETESALEHGGRFVDALLAEPAYRDYARVRGRVSIQTGFSDAGRFVGQIPAALAIERLHGRLARAMGAHGDRKSVV